MTTSAADPGLFGPDSVTWTIHADPSMALGGLRALILHWSALTPFNRALTPSNRAATRRFLKEARAKGWRKRCCSARPAEVGEAQRQAGIDVSEDEAQRLAVKEVRALRAARQAG